MWISLEGSEGRPGPGIRPGLSVLAGRGAGRGVVAGGVAGGGHLDPLLHQAQALVQTQTLVLALAIPGRVDLSKEHFMMQQVRGALETLSAVTSSLLSRMWAQSTQYSSVS